MQETTTSSTVETTTSETSLLDDLRAFAREHRELAKRNYETFSRQYGKPTDRLREWRDRAKASVARWRIEARVGYTKLDRDVEAKTRANGAVHLANATNGASSP